MTSCPRCGAELPEGAKFCVMCGARAEAAEAYATSTLTGSGLTVALATAALCAVIAAGVFLFLTGLF